MEDKSRVLYLAEVVMLEVESLALTRAPDKQGIRRLKKLV